MRLVKLAIGLFILLLLPFLLWGRGVEELFTIDGTISLLRGFGVWGVAAAVLLLVSDILLPIPATLVMTALGMLYGPVVGGLIGAGGSFLGGMIAFLACAKLGRPAARHFVSDAELVRGEALFERWGAWIIVLSRWLPIIPEAVSCMAGIVSMPRRLFTGALACGVVPPAFTFAIVGHLGVDRPALTFLLSAFLPAAFWLVVHRRMRRATSMNST